MFEMFTPCFLRQAKNAESEDEEPDDFELVAFELDLPDEAAPLDPPQAAASRATAVSDKPSMLARRRVRPASRRSVVSYMLQSSLAKVRRTCEGTMNLLSFRPTSGRQRHAKA